MPYDFYIFIGPPLSTYLYITSDNNRRVFLRGNTPLGTQLDMLALMTPLAHLLEDRPTNPLRLRTEEIERVTPLRHLPSAQVSGYVGLSPEDIDTL